MLTITPNKPVIKPNIINSNLRYSKNLNNSQDKISFTGIIIRPVKNKTEIKELVNLFYDAVSHNIEPNKKTFSLLDKFKKYILTYPFITVAKKLSSITELVKSGDKIAGGYSLNVNKANASAHIGFITLAPEYMKTKAGIEILKTIGIRIFQNAKVNDVKELTWTTNSLNKPMNRLLKRFSPEKVRSYAGETEYKISLDDFKDRLKNTISVNKIINY